jgi:hypothetical protein
MNEVEFELFSGELPPVCYEVDVPSGPTRELASVRATARQLSIDEYHALDVRVTLETMQVHDARENENARRRLRLAAVLTKLEGVKGGPIEGKAIGQLLGSPGAAELVHLLWYGYERMVIPDLRFRPIVADDQPTSRAVSAQAGEG